jgi:hypothetical protein
MDKGREEFIERVNQEVIKYSLSLIENGSKDFDQSAAWLVSDLEGLLASVLASAALAVNMDREKFIIYVDQATRDVKQFAMKFYNSKNGDTSG